MKRVYADEKWCIGCHLCEYNCAFANSGESDIIKALKNKPVFPRITVEEDNKITYAVSCRHCDDPICVKSCIAGALSKDNGVIKINKDKCIGCLTCVLVCPYGAVSVGENGVAQKCELCLENSCNEPACVKGCPNRALIYEERGDK